MKRAKAKRMAVALAILGAALVMSGCGKSNSEDNGGGVPGAPGAVIPPGQIIGGGGGCYPINSQIPFAASSIYADYANVVGGAIPSQYTWAGSMYAPTTNSPTTGIGTIVVGGSAAVTGPVYSTLPGRPDGSLQMSLSSGTANYPYNQPYSGYPMGSYWSGSPYYGSVPFNNNGYGTQQVNATGALSISSLVINDIQYRVAMGAIPGTGGGTSYYYGYGLPGWNQYQPVNTNVAMPCVSGMALNMGKWDASYSNGGQNLLYGGQVYLYLNNTAHGYIMYF